MVKLGETDVEMHPLVLGTNIFGWTIDERATHELLDAFLDNGGTTIDTADAYSYWVDGHAGRESETLIGRWLAKRRTRDRIILGTKVSMYPDFPGLSAENIKRAIDASLGSLRTDYVDIYWAHFDDPDTPLEETVAAFDEVVRAGKARFVGISNFDASRVQQWMTIATENGCALPVALQPHYNLINRPSFETELLPVARNWRLGVLPYFGLASGFLTGKFGSLEEIKSTDRAEITLDYYSDEAMTVVEVARRIAEEHGVTTAAVALAWLASRETVVGPIASARNSHQLSELMVIGDLRLSVQDLADLDAVSAMVPVPTPG